MSRLTAALIWGAVYAFLVYDVDLKDKDEVGGLAGVTAVYLGFMATIYAIE